jgi:hypothetical protein
VAERNPPTLRGLEPLNPFKPGYRNIQVAAMNPVRVKPIHMSMVSMGV